MEGGAMPRALIVRAEGSPFGTRLARVIRTLRDEGWECDVVHAQGTLGRSDPTAVGRDLREEVHLYEFPAPRGVVTKILQQMTGSGYFGSERMRQLIRQLVTRTEYQLILVKDSPALVSVFDVLDGCNRAGVPVICEMVEPRVAQAYDSLIRYGTWATRLSAHVRRILPKLRDAERVYLPRCERVFVVCDEMKEWLTDNYPIESSKVSVVQNVEILSVFDATSAEGVPRRFAPRISFVGTFGPHRGVELLIEAAGMVRRRGGTGEFRLSIVGASRDEMQRLDRLCRSYGVGDIAELSPYVAHPLAMEWIKQTDIGVIPHLDTPGIRTTVPFKLFQYMAAGAACIVSDVGPLGRIVRETGAGLAFKAGSTSDLADKIHDLLMHPDRARAMGDKGRRTSEERFNWETESRAYADCFRWLERAEIRPAVS
jgi:glycosyltransferase involved in cell wall biosynthesis